MFPRQSSMRFDSVETRQIASLTPYIKKHFVYTRKSLKSELWSPVHSRLQLDSLRPRPPAPRLGALWLFIPFLSYPVGPALPGKTLLVWTLKF